MLSSLSGKIVSMLTIGDRIKQKRIELGFSQKDLAHCIGNVSRAAISLWETGSTKGLKPENLLNTAKCLGESIEWLVTGKKSTGDINIEPSNLPQKSRNQLLSIIKAAELGKISEHDIELLSSISKYLENR